MTNYDEYRQKVCTQCDIYFLECEATDDNIEDCIHAATPLEDAE